MKKLSLKNTITISIFIFFTICTSILFYILFNFYSKSIENTYVSENKVFLENAMSKIEKTGEKLSGQARAIATKHQTKDMVISGYYTLPKVELTKEIVKDIKIKNNKIESLFAFKKIGRISGIKYASSFGYDLGVFNVAIYDKESKLVSYAYIKKTFLETNDKEYIEKTLLEYRTPDFGKYIIQNTEEGIYLKGFYNIKTDDYESNRYALIVMKGVVVTGSRIKKDYFDDLKKKLGRDFILIQDGEIKASTIYENNKRLLGKKELIKNKAGYYELHGLKKSYGFNFLEIKDYKGECIAKIGAAFDMNELKTLSNKSIKKFFYYQLLFSIILFILLYLLLDYIFKPMQEIVSGVKRVSKGKYDEKLNLNYGIELRTFSEAINLLSDEVKRREESLEDLNRSLEEKVEKRTEELVKANKAKDQFLANMSHEIRTPMNGIAGFLDLLLSTEISVEQKDYVKEIRTSTEHLLNIINDILDYSKIEAGNIDFENIEFDIYKVIEESVSIFYQRVYEKGIEINFYIEENIPRLIKSDPMRVKQVLINLIGNAIKFTNEGGIMISVKGKKYENEFELEFSIKDSGIGISKEKQKNIYKAFTQADFSVTRKFGGTGLGLAISKNIVEALKGKMELLSEEGKGAEFIFKIIVESSKSKIEDLSEFEGMKVLLIDEKIEETKIFTKYFKNLKMEYKIEGKVIEVMKKDISSYDLVVISDSLKGISSKAFLEYCRDEYPDFKGKKILVSSKYLGKEQGIDSYIKRPIKISDFKNKIASIFKFTKYKFEIKKERVRSIENKEENKRYKVILAEDNKTNSKLAKKILMKLGFEDILIAENGIKAVEFAKEYNPDIIFMDCQMPEMSGYEASEKIREFNKAVPIVAITAGVTEQTRKACYASGMNHYMTKPFHIEKLIEIIEKYLYEVNKKDIKDLDKEIVIEKLGIKIDEISKKTGLSTNEINEIIEDFKLEIDARLLSIEEHIEKDDFEKLENEIHSLKGVFSNFILDDLVNLCVKLEDKIQEKNGALCREYYKEIKMNLKKYI